MMKYGDIIIELYQLPDLVGVKKTALSIPLLLMYLILRKPSWPRKRQDFLPLKRNRCSFLFGNGDASIFTFRVRTGKGWNFVRLFNA
jgi:hypothetical protein